MKKNVFILWCFTIALNSFGQDTDSILNKAMDEISIATAQYYVLKINKKNLPDSISTSDKLLEVLNNQYKEDNEIKELVKKLQKCKEDYKQEPINEYLNSALSIIKFKKLDNKELLKKLSKIIGNYTNDNKSNKTEHNAQNFNKQDGKLKEKEKLEQENTSIRDSLSYYQNNKPELKPESNFIVYVLFIVVVLLLGIIAWLLKDKVFQLFKDKTRAKTVTDVPNQKKEINYLEEDIQSFKDETKAKTVTDASNQKKEINYLEEDIQSFKDETKAKTVTDASNQKKEDIEPNKFVMEDQKNVDDLTSTEQNPVTAFIPNNAILAKGDWFVVGSSVIGKSHIEGNIPCQDFNHLEKIDDLWGIAVSCDGAGSATNSHIGSEFVAKESAKIFKGIFLTEQIGKNNELPQDNIWQDLAKRGLYQVKQNLDNFAQNKDYKVESLACTVILAIYSPFGILVTHIGDGRAGFLTQNNEWKPMLTPWKGEEANQTVFITSAIWNENIDNYIESRIIREQPLAFTLMSDGCEAHSFVCSVLDQETSEWHDPNLPYPNFFNPLVQSLKQMKATGTTEDEVQKKWANFLTSGTQRLSDEPDDKTLILGVFVSENH